MNDVPKLNDVDKARAVWAATKMSKTPPLNEKALKDLADKLRWAAIWRASAATQLPPRNRETMGSIEKHAKALARLLSEEPATRLIVERHWPGIADAIEWPYLSRTIRSLTDLSNAAHAAKEHRGSGPEFKKLYSSSQQIFIVRLGKIYLEVGGCKPSYTRDDDGRPSGAFVWFVRETSEQFCEGMSAPAPDTIKAAVNLMNKQDSKSDLIISVSMGNGRGKKVAPYP